MKRTMLGLTALAAAASAAAAPLPAHAAKGTVGVPGCSVTYDTGQVAVNPFTGQIAYSGPDFAADTSSCVPETPPQDG